MNEDFANELLKVVKKPKTEMALKAKKQKEQEERLNVLCESYCKAIRENLLKAAKEGKAEIDENGNLTVSCIRAIGSTFTYDHSSIHPFCPRLSSDLFNVQLLHKTKGQGVFRSSRDSKATIYFKVEPLAKRVFECILSMEDEGINSRLITRVCRDYTNNVLSKVFSENVFEDYLDVSETLSGTFKTDWNKDVAISLVVKSSIRLKL